MASPGQWVLAEARWGGRGHLGLLEGSGGGEIDRGGRRGIGSRGCRPAIVAYIHGFLTIAGGVG